MAAQLVLGLINGAFYALLSLGMAIIFGMLNVINFAHGALYMTGAFAAWMLLQYAGISFWWALFLAPAMVAALGVVIERALLARLYHLDHVYGWLVTFGLALMLESVFRYYFGVSGKPYAPPAALQGSLDLGFMLLPAYRAWVIGAALVLCAAVWLLIERTPFGARLRAAVENPSLVRAFGINVPRMMTLTYALGGALAGLAGVLAAPIYQVTPLMGSQIIVVVFAVVVIGGLGSIVGSIVTGFGLGLAQGVTKLFYPEGANVVVFIIMAAVLLLAPAGLAGRR